MNLSELLSIAKKVRVSGVEIQELSSEVGGLLLKYAELLSKWTKRMDLVSSPDINRIVTEHILDSVAAFQSVSRETLPEGIPFLDIGSGAGLPGVVFAILAPERNTYLVEPRAKRVDFLKECRRALKLDNRVSIICKRLEELNISDIPTGPVHAIERAVGMESEIYQTIGKRHPGSFCSYLVSKNWVAPRELEDNIVASTDYSVEESRAGVVVTVKCFT